MFAEILSWLFPVEMPRPMYPDDVKTSMDFRHRTHEWDGRNENPDPAILMHRYRAGKARRLALVLDAAQDGEWSIQHVESDYQARARGDVRGLHLL